MWKKVRDKSIEAYNVKNMPLYKCLSFFMVRHKRDERV